MDTHTAVLLVIDMQEGFMKPHLAKLPEKIADFIVRWEEAGDETVFTRYLNYPGSPCEKYLNWSRMQGPPETDICEELRPYAGLVIDKTFYTAVTSAFRDIAEQKGWQTIVCCGTDTAACVQKTALDIFDWGKRPFVISDLCGSGAGDEAHEAALIALRRAIGEDQVGNSEAAIKIRGQ